MMAIVLDTPTNSDAATVKAYLETEYCVIGKTPFVMRIGIASEPLALLYKQHRTNCAAFITACNPFSKIIGNTANIARQEQLKQELAQRSLTFLDGIGKHPSNGWPEEPSYLVMALSLEAAKKIGNKFEQNAIVWCDADAIPELILLK